MTSFGNKMKSMIDKQEEKKRILWIKMFYWSLQRAVCPPSISLGETHCEYKKRNFNQIKTRDFLCQFLILFVVYGTCDLKGSLSKLKIQPNVFLMHSKLRLDPIYPTPSNHLSPFSPSLECNASATRPCTPVAIRYPNEPSKFLSNFLC